MKFNINHYEGKYVMHCKTQAELNDFFAYLKANALPTPYHNGSCYYGKNVYYFNRPVCWSSIEYAKQTGYTILEWEDFMNNTFTKAELKTGDIIKQRDGMVSIVNADFNMAITQNGWINLSYYNDDLTSTHNKDFDIIAVRRPEHPGECQFNAFDLKFGILIYEQEEVEEMTLAQVCELLGKNIKIVK